MVKYCTNLFLRAVVVFAVFAVCYVYTSLYSLHFPPFPVFIDSKVKLIVIVYTYLGLFGHFLYKIVSRKIWISSEIRFKLNTVGFLCEINRQYFIKSF